MKCSKILLALLLTGAFALTANQLEAQSLYGFDGAGSLVVEATGPPGGPCGYPTGPMLSAYPTPLSWICPLPVTMGPPPANIIGDLAVDKVNDTVWVTDGIILGEYVASGGGMGTPVTGFVPAPFGSGAPLTGLGMDSAAGLLWMTEGLFAQALIPPPPPGCPAAGVVAVPPFPLPLPIPGSLATDIEWNPVTGTLWICDTAGMVTEVVIGGAMGPFGTWPAAAGMCGLAPPLQGIAIDTVATAVTGLPTIYVTDGFMIDYQVPGGAPAPPTFYSPFPCIPTMGPLLGLAFAGRALPYGVGGDNSGLVPPTIGSIGQGLSPSATFTVTLAGSVPGSTAILYVSWGGLYCPALMVMGLPVLINLVPTPLMLGAVPVGPGGGAMLTTGIPAGYAPGNSFWLQWLVVTPNPSLQVSDGLALTIDLP